MRLRGLGFQLLERVIAQSAQQLFVERTGFLFGFGRFGGGLAGRFFGRQTSDRSRYRGDGEQETAEYESCREESMPTASVAWQAYLVGDPAKLQQGA